MKTPTISSLVMQGGMMVVYYQSKWNWKRFCFEAIKVRGYKAIIEMPSEALYFFLYSGEVYYADTKERMAKMEINEQ